MRQEVTGGPAVRIALANLGFPGSGHEAVHMAEQAIAEAGRNGAGIICFPECFVPGYRAYGATLSEPDAGFLEGAWSRIGVAAAKARVAVVLGTERIVEGQLRISALVFDQDGSRLGFQDKVQLDPSEETTYSPGQTRRIFQVGELTFGVAICHEGWRYPETFRWAARRGAKIVFHPHFHKKEPGGYEPTVFADPLNTFHEKAMLCRAAENTCYVASVNYASQGAPTTSAVANPDGSLLCHQPYGKAGLLAADIDLAAATRLLANRSKPIDGEQTIPECASDPHAPPVL